MSFQIVDLKSIILFNFFLNLKDYYDANKTCYKCSTQIIFFYIKKKILLTN